MPYQDEQWYCEYCDGYENFGFNTEEECKKHEWECHLKKRECRHEWEYGDKHSTYVKVEHKELDHRECKLCGLRQKLTAHLHCMETTDVPDPEKFWEMFPAKYIESMEW